MLLLDAFESYEILIFLKSFSFISKKSLSFVLLIAKKDELKLNYFALYLHIWVCKNFKHCLSDIIANLSFILHEIS